MVTGQDGIPDLLFLVGTIQDWLTYAPLAKEARGRGSHGQDMTLDQLFLSSGASRFQFPNKAAND